MTRSPLHTMTHWPVRSPGKTTFLKFMLVRLISARQVILLCDNPDVYLFYCGQVYYRSGESGFKDLPQHQGTSYYPIWTLVDVFQPPPITSNLNIWPIQTTSLNPILWDRWSKQLGAAMLGMPLWDVEELIEGYVFSLFPFPVINPGCIIR